MTETLDRLTKLAAQRNARLESLREACLPICRLIAPLRTPGDHEYRVTCQTQHTNVGGCSWLMISRPGHTTYEISEDGEEPWTIEREVNASGGWTHGDFGSPKPHGPTPHQLRDFAAWLADPVTLRAIADLEQETAEQVTGLTRKLNAAATVLQD